jgi:ElaB/YqjD/DUF883 family membrane-anchored ribosome-binding protein
LNNKHIDKKIIQEAANVKEDIRILAEDSAARVETYESILNQAAMKARETVAAWVADNISRLGTEMENFTGEAKDTVTGAAGTLKKEVGQGLVQYNAKAQEVIEKVSPTLTAKASRYPWVSISAAVLLGFVLGGLLIKPVRQPLR